MTKDVTTDVHKNISVSTVVTMNVHEDTGGRPQMCDITGVPKILWPANNVFKKRLCRKCGRPWMPRWMSVNILMEVYGRNFVKNDGRPNVS